MKSDFASILSLTKQMTKPTSVRSTSNTLKQRIYVCAALLLIKDNRTEDFFLLILYHTQTMKMYIDLF
jgi:hypothetical protein